MSEETICELKNKEICDKIIFIKSSLLSQKNKILVKVNINKLDKSWQKDGEYYIKSCEEGIIGRRERVEEYIKTGEPIEAPSISLYGDNIVSFTDGRHRFAVLRDMGCENISVSVPKNQVNTFKSLFGND